ncbi:class I SAM-dependent methyltransferase [Arenimonas terrae]|uniref:Class I SAM-dependent methyltransferase n=1 Tax=Arenimonas terrae TaxID=2546226 RepID=A0A5C4RWE7_9GAMM|nr:class I SAM-dependent methyltransferase [Arenimonas terrae]TNJ35490.1 class I SAM-dependent methyltransferase [Arenimonas terrae]
MNCRFCAAPLKDVFLDLGSAPPSNAYLDAAALRAPEAWFPLKLHTCTACRLVQVDEVQDHASIFSADYAYFSSYSRSWLAHAQAYVGLAVARLGLTPASWVVEIASNDGYLLQYVQTAGIPCLGVEPTRGTAEAARARGIETVQAFFGLAMARDLVAGRGQADLVVANNVLAHVPDLNDFVAGLAVVLAPGGTVTLEFPHLMQLVAQRQFDTVYHEHFSYFSLQTAVRVLAAHGLEVWDVEELPTHGGSLRLWASHAGRRDRGASVDALLSRELAAGMGQDDFYRGFQAAADAVKHDLLAFLLEQRRAGRRVAGYGAAAKGNTLLNYAGVRPDLLPYVADASPHKQGRYLPGSRIPVVDEGQLRADRPDIVLVLPWNLRAEISTQLDYIREWGGRFAAAVPRMELW